MKESLLKRAEASTIPGDLKHRQKENRRRDKEAGLREEGTERCPGPDPAHEPGNCCCPGKRLSAEGGRTAQLTAVLRKFLDPRLISTEENTQAQRPWGPSQPLPAHSASPGRGSCSQVRRELPGSGQEEEAE